MSGASLEGDAALTVVIPTTESSSEDVLTLDSIPDDVHVNLERQGSLNEARNRGVVTAPTDRIIIMDDDLEFPTELLERFADRLDEQTLVGLADWDFGLVAGRVMAFHRDLWEDIGGFNERLGSHMGDTDFALRAWRAGKDLETVPRELLYHEPHERSISTWDRVWRLAYLAATHPRDAPRLAKGVLP